MRVIKMIVTYERNVQFVHYGVKGMKWGIRRYQNPDGSLTPLGRTRLGGKAVKEHNKATKALIKGKTEKAEKHIQKFDKIDKKIPKEADELAERFEKESFYNQKKSRDASKLSYDELSERIGRLKTESDYKKLMKNRENPDVERGIEAGKQTAEKIGKTTIAALGTSLAVYFGSRAISKAFGIKTPNHDFNQMWKYAKPDKK